MIQNRTKDNSLTVFNPVEGLNMGNNFKDYVKDRMDESDALHLLEMNVDYALSNIDHVKDCITMPTKSIPKPLRKRIKKLGIDLK